MKKYFTHQKKLQIIWLIVTVLFAFLLWKFIFPNAQYTSVLMFTHITITIIFTQILLGIAEIIFKRQEPWMDLLVFLLFSIASFTITLLGALIISKVFHLAFATGYIIVVLIVQLFPEKEESETSNN